MDRTLYWLELIDTYIIITSHNIIIFILVCSEWLKEGWLIGPSLVYPTFGFGKPYHSNWIKPLCCWETLQRLAEHPTLPMSGVSLSPVSNPNPNKPTLMGCIKVAWPPCRWRVPICALLHAGLWELQAYKYCWGDPVYTRPNTGLGYRTAATVLMLVMYTNCLAVVPIAEEVGTTWEILYGLYLASRDN